MDNDSANVWRETKDLLWARRRRLTMGLGLGLVLLGRLAALVLPGTSKYLVDEVALKGRQDLLLPLAAAVAAASLFQAACAFAVSRILGVAAQRSIMEIRRRLHEHVLRLPVRYFDRTQTGVLISRVMYDPDGVKYLFGSGLVTLAGAAVTALGALTALLYINYRLTLGLALPLALYTWGMAVAFRRLRGIYGDRGRLQAELTGRLNETLAGIRVVKAYTAEKREEIVFTTKIHDLFRAVNASVTRVAAIDASSTMMAAMIGIVILVVGGRAVLDGSMTAGDLVLYIVLTALVVAPIEQLTSLGREIGEAAAGLDRVQEFLRAPREELGKTMGALPGGRIRGDVAFENVTFSYTAETTVLRDISFRARAGTTTALVGPSGAGKTTLLSLILAFNSPTRGRVLVDDTDLATVAIRAYRSQLGIVLQNDFLFDGTLAENIAYGSPHARREDIRKAARIAHVEEFATLFPDGLETLIGERGVRLSGGQRQRVSIARAILADPRILILDEATSNLDSESEALIQDALRALCRARTTFIVAHRLSTIRCADHILFLERGTILERGTHEELIATGNRYRQFYERQQGLAGLRRGNARRAVPALAL